MKIKTKTKVNENKITITTEVQHEFSKLELEILKCLFIDGRYESKFVDACDPKSQLESHAMYLLQKLDLAEEDEWSWRYTINAKNKNVIEQILEGYNVK